MSNREVVVLVVDRIGLSLYELGSICNLGNAGRSVQL